jgi:uncharacterized protein (DUF1684 family)
MGNLKLGGTALVLSGIALCAFTMGQTSESKMSYADELAKWRQTQEKDLKANEGWLSVAGLFWLKEGANKIGTAPGCEVPLPAGSAPTIVGVITLQGTSVTLAVKDGVNVTQQDRGSNTTIEGGGIGVGFGLKPDSTRINVGALTFMVIHRGDRMGVRLFDKSCKGYKEFKGLKWFAPNSKYVVKARFMPYDPPKSVNITNVIGDTVPVPVVGYVEFKLDGKTCHLDAQGSGSGLFINFRDNTSGKETYPAGRFLDAPKPVNGEVTIDFNRATNPPCAFTSFATCPLPPRQNYLDIAISAGEMTHHPEGE